MKKIFLGFIAMMVLLNSFGASAVSNTVVAKTAQEERISNASRLYDEAMADGNMTYDEMKAIATEMKGSKLSFKEKIGLRLMNKKLEKKSGGGDGKSQLIALLLCGFLGGLGIHRFYLGYTWQGIVQLLTLGGCGIWSLIDFIRIITGSLQPKDGQYGTTL